MIRYHQQLGVVEAELLGRVLANPAGAPEADLHRVADTLTAYLVRTTLNFHPSHFSVLAADADGLGKRILAQSHPDHQMGLYVDWLKTQQVGGGLNVSLIGPKFRELHANALTALAIVDPLPFDYEPLVRRLLEHVEKPGLERILSVAGVISEEWVEQLELDLNLDVSISLQAFAIVPEGFDLAPFRSTLEPYLREPMINTFPRIVRDILDALP